MSLVSAKADEQNIMIHDRGITAKRISRHVDVDHMMSGVFGDHIADILISESVSFHFGNYSFFTISSMNDVASRVFRMGNAVTRIDELIQRTANFLSTSRYSFH